MADARTGLLLLSFGGGWSSLNRASIPAAGGKFRACL